MHAAPESRRMSRRTVRVPGLRRIDRPGSLDKAGARPRRRPARRCRPAGAASLRADAGADRPPRGRASRPCTGGGGVLQPEPPAPVADQQALELGMLAGVERAGHRRVDQGPEAIGQRHRPARQRRCLDSLPTSREQDHDQAGDPREPAEQDEQPITAQERRGRERQPVRLDLARRQHRLDRDRDRRQILGRRSVLAAQVVLQVVAARLQAVIDDVIAECRTVRIGVRDPDDDRRAAILDRPGLELAARARTAGRSSPACRRWTSSAAADLVLATAGRRQGDQEQQPGPTQEIARRIAIGLLVRAGCGA